MTNRSVSLLALIQDQEGGKVPEQTDEQAIEQLLKSGYIEILTIEGDKKTYQVTKRGAGFLKTVRGHIRYEDLASAQNPTALSKLLFHVLGPTAGTHESFFLEAVFKRMDKSTLDKIQNALDKSKVEKEEKVMGEPAKAAQ